MIKKVGAAAVLGLFVVSFMMFSRTDENIEIEFQISEFDDEEYPSNPDIGFRSSGYRTSFFLKGSIKRNEESLYTLEFQTKEGSSIILNDIDLSTWIPTIPDKFRTNHYLTNIALINQEWNRNQIAFGENEFVTDLENVKRIDLARNCLNSYLWEVLVYTEEDKKILPYAHGWFNFPKEVYQELFFEINQRPFNEFAEYLEEWKLPKSKKISRDVLRKEIEAISVDYKDLSDGMYPITGERAKKMDEILHPQIFSTMKELQTDSTLFATFVPPGIYDKSSPRKTQLGRFFYLDTIMLRKTEQAESDELLHEMEMVFSDKEKTRTTKLLIGGLDFGKLKTLNEKDAHNGWQNSVGFGNHTFYEHYSEHIKNSPKNSPYYSYVTDENDKWIDSHEIGIDGPLIHFDDKSRNKLHVWLLSFERHALVGHYTLQWQ